MFLSKQRSGIYYLFFFDDLGKRHKVSTKTTLKSEALKFLQSFRQEHRTAKAAPTLLSRFAEDYLTYSRTVHRPKSTESAATALRELQKVLGDRPLHNIGVRDVENFVGAKQQEASPRTARVYLVTLASTFETARRWALIQTNPFRLVEKPRLPESTPSYLTPEQFQLLLATVRNQTLHDLILCAAMTGLRLSELTSLRWEDIDFGRRLLRVQNSAEFTTKSKKNRIVPVNRWVYNLLDQRRPESASGLVFHIEGRRLRKEYVSKGFKRAVRRAGLDEGLHFHSLRHTFASWLVQRGAPLLEVQRLLGHSTMSMTQAYTHLLPQHLRENVDNLECPGY